MSLKIVKEDTELQRYVEARKARDEADNRLKDAEKALMEKMTREERKSFSLQDGGKIYKATFVQNMRPQVNEEGLKKAIGTIPFRKLTTAKLDTKKLEAALDDGTLDPVIVGQYITNLPSKPFLRFTEGQVQHDQSSNADSAEHG